MIRFEERVGTLNATDLGRTSSHFYVKYNTIEVFNELLKPGLVTIQYLNSIPLTFHNQGSV